MNKCKICSIEIGEGLEVCEKCSVLLHPGEQTVGDIDPGDFYEIPVDSNVSNVSQFLRRKESQEVKLEVSERLVKSYKTFIENFHPKTDVVYYPSCGADSSPSISFTGSKIIYLDLDKRCIDALKKSGYEAVEANSNTFKPDVPVNILILLNPASKIETPVSTVQDDGYILCNDYHSTAKELYKNPEFKLVAVIRTSGNGILDQENLEDYFRQIDNDDELKKAPFTWGDYVNYNSAVQQLMKVLDKEDVEKAKSTGNIVMLYKEKIIDADIDSSKLLYGFKLNLPNKKGTVDDTFIFQKKIK